MTSSPMLASAAHTPLGVSPLSSPQLRPVPAAVHPHKSLSMAPTAAKSATLSPPLLATPPSAKIPGLSISIASSASSSLGMSPPCGLGVSPGRSYARAPPVRPYASPRLAKRSLRDIDGEVEAFAQKVLDVAFARSRVRKTAGSGAVERVELIVDIPVWSPGCFTDLSTLHALRDTTLAHTHAIIAHLGSHGISASYRLLARCPNSVGWGCIRLAPGATSAPPLSSASMPPAPARRRTSFVKPERRGSLGLSLECAIDDEDDDGERDETGNVMLRSGYSTGGSDDEDDDEADVLVKREVDKRGGKENTSFVMSLRSQPALILI